MNLKLAPLIIFIVLQLIIQSCSKIDISRIPLVTEDSVLEVKPNSAVVMSKIIDIGEGEVEFGHCWSVSQNPIVENTNTNFKSIQSAIDFESHIENLTPNTKYFVRHYIFDGSSYSYGEEFYFTTIDYNATENNILSIVELIPNNYSENFELDDTIIVRFNKALDILTIDESAIFISESFSKLDVEIIYIDESYEIQIIPKLELLLDSKYEIVVTENLKALDSSYLTTKNFEFSTINYFIDSRDGELYQAVRVGDQIWMAENLKAITYQNGDPIMNGSSVGDYSNEVDPKYYFAYNDDESHVDIYGRLYTWGVVDDQRNVCPIGWHVPSDYEWNELQMQLGMNPSDLEFIGGSENGISALLKETGTSHWQSPNTGATNVIGFTALPGGYRRRFDKEFDYLVERAFFWTSSKYDSDYSYFRSLYYDSPHIFRSYNFKNYGFSIRCVKD